MPTKYESLLPVILLCAVFGFPTVSSHQPRLHKLFCVYRWIASVVMCTSFILHILATSLYAYMDLTHMSVLAPVGEVLWVIVLFYYHIKHTLFGDGNTFDSISYLDKKLESLHIKIPHRQNEIISSVCIIVIMLLNMMMLCKIISHRPGMNDAISVIGPVCYIVVGSASILYATTFNIRLFFLLYFLRQRMRLIWKASMNYNKRRVAWSNRGNPPVLRTLSGSVGFLEDTCYVKTLAFLCRFSFDIFESNKTFYSCFLNTYVFIQSVLYPVQLIINIQQKHDICLLFTSRWV